MNTRALRDSTPWQDRFRLRLWVALGFVFCCFGLLVARLAYLQIAKHEELAAAAENNRVTVVPVPPNRGLIVDRNGVVLATNYSAYTLEITPSTVKKNGQDLERLIDELAARGKAVLMVSSYMPELLGVCDRIAVMVRGRLGPARPVAELTEHALLLEATG